MCEWAGQGLPALRQQLIHDTSGFAGVAGILIKLRSIVTIQPAQSWSSPLVSPYIARAMMVEAVFLKAESYGCVSREISYSCRELGRLLAPHWCEFLSYQGLPRGYKMGRTRSTRPVLHESANTCPSDAGPFILSSSEETVNLTKSLSISCQATRPRLHPAYKREPHYPSSRLKLSCFTSLPTGFFARSRAL